MGTTGVRGQNRRNRSGRPRHLRPEAGVSIARNPAVYFPHYVAEDPVRDNQPSAFGPGGMVAAVIAASDTTRGVWKAPAGIDAGLAGANVCT
jgi:hypothetical protein